MTKTTKANNENLEKLIVEYRPQLKSFIGKRVDNKQDAEDILQDVFERLIKTVQMTLNPIEHLSAWLYRVAQNLIINRRTKKREAQMPVYQQDDGDEIMQDFAEILFADNSTPETEYLRSLIWQELETALAELPAEQREIYELTEFDGIPVKEIAKATGVQVNTLLSRKHYAVLHLRKKLSMLYEEVIMA
ncbi:MAG: sigma-70 family RNA polymerase sigma factor [Prevotellaceae bacterium]|jgi:RNA polymerase sigma factor (sigma-70 family)|nr:sigma-70 family RNA polymerase sigma factor [Prevotellaceae bacterium]